MFSKQLNHSLWEINVHQSKDYYHKQDLLETDRTAFSIHTWKKQNSKIKLQILFCHTQGTYSKYIFNNFSTIKVI